MLKEYDLKGYGVTAALDDEAKEVYITSRSLEERLGLVTDSIRQKVSSKSMKALLRTDSNPVKSIKRTYFDVSGDLRQVKLYSLADATKIIAFLSSQGNIEATKILMVGFADSARSLVFELAGETLTCEARDKWIELRLQSKQTRLSLTDRLKAIGYTEGVDYARTTLRVYSLIGLLPAYQEWKASNSKVPFRDSITPDQLHDVEWAEKTIARLVVKGMTISEAIEVLQA
jgi:hypothetical protein